MFGSEAKAGLLAEVTVAPRIEGDSGSSLKQAVKLIFCAAGLQVGPLQEWRVVLTPSTGAVFVQLWDVVSCLLCALLSGDSLFEIDAPRLLVV